jgi:hypothetical protein
MRPLSSPDAQSPLRVALAASLLLHALILFSPQRPHPPADHRVTRLSVTLAPSARTSPQPAPPPASPVILAPAAPAPAPVPVPAVPKPSPPINPSRKKTLAVKSARKSKTAPSVPSAPQPPTAEKDDMGTFLDEQRKHRPSLAQRALAMAGAIGRKPLAEENGSEGSELVERLPDSPPPDPFSLEMYLDSLIKKLNKSAAFVKNDPRKVGIKQASVVIHLNPDGSLKRFDIRYAGDQEDRIAFIRSVVERATPFASFPPDLRKSAKSLGLLICIEPPSLSDGAIGFSRREGGRGC